MKKSLLILLLIFFSSINAIADYPEYFKNRYNFETDQYVYQLYFQIVPVSPGLNINAFVNIIDNNQLFSPKPPIENLFLGPMVYHGGIMRMGGYLENCQFIEQFDSLVLCCHCLEFEKVK